MTNNETKDSDLPCHTMDLHGLGWGGGGVGWIELDWMKIGENFNFVPPQLEPLRAATVRDQTLFEIAGQAGFVGLFIGHYYWYRLA
jgi:hypothetical protein